MSWPQYLTEKARDLTRRLRPDDDTEVAFADWVDDDSLPAEETMRRFQALGPTPTVGSVLDEAPPPPYVPLHDYSGDNWRDHNIEPETFEAADWLELADDLARWGEDLPKARKRRNQRIARLRKQVAATPLPSQVTT